jgi:hypothetical protein
METGLDEGRKSGQDAILAAGLKIFGIEPVDTDNDRRMTGQLVRSSVKFNGGHFEGLV